MYTAERVISLITLLSLFMLPSFLGRVFVVWVNDKTPLPTIGQHLVLGGREGPHFVNSRFMLRVSLGVVSELRCLAQLDAAIGAYKRLCDRRSRYRQ
jgi:hypothetical protein